MYVYFNKNGDLKESLNTRAMRVGNSGWNKIFSYFEGSSASVSAVKIKYYLPDGTETQDYFYNSHLNDFLPILEKQDLKFFKQDKPYEFYVFNVPDVVLALTGTVDFVITYTIGEGTDAEFISMGKNAFEVNGVSSFKPDENINIAQYNSLLKQIENTLKSSDVSNYQINVALAINPTTNLNDRTFVHYTAVSSGNNYIIKYDGNNLTENQAKEYLKYMNGSRFLPKYDYNYPKQVLLMFANNKIYKAQYDNTNGLVLYYVNEIFTRNTLGFDATKTQILKNINGIVRWVDED